MAKYVVDLDSLISCLDFISEGKMNGKYDWAYLQNVKAFIEAFPKDKIEEEDGIGRYRDDSVEGNV